VKASDLAYVNEYRRLRTGKSINRRIFIPRIAALVLVAATLILFLDSCGKSSSSERVSLPPTPVLSINSTWAVVKSSLLRVREGPTNQATVLSHIRMGAVMEVLTKSDQKDTVENDTAYWYRIDYQGLKGWVFGSYIEIFDSRAKADSYSSTLQ
jgi:uncharacterized protein YgiM (DUF1202 family)